MKKERCTLYKCKNSKDCIRSSSRFFDLYEVVGIPVKEPPNPFWSHLRSIGLCIFMRCRQYKSRWKASRSRTSGTGGNYHILFNSEGNGHYGNRDNSLF
nr:hypothetical transcript [Hymenolepis microstoma]